MPQKPDSSDTLPNALTPGPGHDWNDRFSRRRFLVGTGKAGALTILALHGFKVEVVAGTASGSANM